MPKLWKKQTSEEVLSIHIVHPTTRLPHILILAERKSTQSLESSVCHVLIPLTHLTIKDATAHNEFIVLHRTTVQLPTVIRLCQTQIATHDVGRHWHTTLQFLHILIRSLIKRPCLYPRRCPRGTMRNWLTVFAVRRNLNRIVVKKIFVSHNNSYIKIKPWQRIIIRALPILYHKTRPTVSIPSLQAVATGVTRFTIV